MAKSKKQLTQKVVDFVNLVKSIKSSDSKLHGGVKMMQKQDFPFYLSTGDQVLDLYISNRKNGGIPGGVITELSGLQGCVTQDTLIKIKIQE